jgi:hypothetical protein
VGRRRTLAALFLLAALAAIAAGPTPAAADPGVGVSVSDIRVDQPLAPGGRYRLPAVAVINTGSQASFYELAISHPADRARLRPSESWFRFQPDLFALAPGDSRSVSVSLLLPPGAPPGDYFAYLVARPVSRAEGVTIGIAAATRLEFTIKPSSWLEARRLWLARNLEAAQPWPLLFVVGLALLLAGRAFLFRFRLRIERRP